jgi:hypothetical protein
MGSDTIADPEKDARSTYAVEPALAGTLTSRMGCVPRHDRRVAAAG